MSGTAMQMPAIKVQRLYLQVAEQLQEQIADGTFDGGSRLPSERDLAGQFGVSRPTIREAMIALEIAGVVEVRSGSGVYVKEAPSEPRHTIDLEDPGPFEILEARKVIESETCALAAQRISDAQLVQLARLLKDMEEENQQQAITESADEQFHCLIARAAQNSALSATVAWLWQLRNNSPISTHFHARLRREGDRPILADHHAILKALQARNASRARKAMHNHLQRVIDHLLEVV